jgi:phytanoyl-CoA hydroxylase
MLSKAQIEQYWEEGAIVVEGVLDELTRRRMKQVVAELVEKSRAVTSHDNVYDLEPGHTREEPRVRRIKKPHLVDRVFHDFMFAERLLAIQQDLLGKSIRLHGSKLNLKSPRFGSAVEWHQDWAFYPHTNDDLLAMGVMLEDTMLENGAMLYVPGTHKGETYSHHGDDGLFCGAIDPAACKLDFSAAAAATGPAGSVSFHHVRLVHGSAQNTSNRPRELLLYETGAADAYPLMGVGDWDDFHGRLLCGEETIVPRFVQTPARLPLPPAKNQGSIYENQTASGKRFFAKVEVPQQKVAAAGS